MTKFITKLSDKEIAITSLQVAKNEIETTHTNNLHQVTFNIISDKLRRYLGASSEIYKAFSEINITPTGMRDANVQTACKLLDASIAIIQSNGTYKDLQLQLVELQIKDMRRKWIIAIFAAIGGAILTNAKDILRYLLSLFHLPPP